MISNIFNELFNTPKYRQLGISVFSGVLSFLFGLVFIRLPELGGGSTSDLREIPLLISLLYINNPWYLLISSAITAFGVPAEGSYLTWFFMHFIPLFLGWHAFQQIKKSRPKNLKLLFVWSLLVVGYYGLIMVPVSILVNLIQDSAYYKSDPITSYLTILPKIKFEIIFTTLVTGSYLIQHEARTALRNHKENLQKLVKSKTKELVIANQELQTANSDLLTRNAEIKELNLNLDEIVKERTKKVHHQFDQLLKYAHINSHEVRAPLSRIQALIPIFLEEKDKKSKSYMKEQLLASTDELDSIIKNMNEILESEVRS